MEDIIIHNENKVKRNGFHLWGIVCTGQYFWGAIPLYSIVRGRSHLSAFLFL